MSTWRLMIGLILLGGVAACSDPAPPPTASPMTPEERARSAVAQRLELPLNQVVLISSAARDFADSSLDCPEPDMAYQQVITPGHQVIVEAEGRRFDVRVTGTAAKICRRRKGRSPSTSRDSASELAAIARADLASRLPAAVADITVMSVRALRRGDELSGCQIDCKNDEQICGYAIGLVHDSRRYDYLAHQGTVQPCPAILPG